MEGALARDPASERAAAGKRRREREGHWRDEVRERVNRRRQRLGPGEEAELPLFSQPAARPASPPEPPAQARLPVDEALPAHLPLAGPTELGLEAGAASAADVGELLLREPDPPVGLTVPEPVPRRSEPEPGLDAESVVDRDDWILDEPRPATPQALVDRPARAGERLQAALVDLGVLAGLWAGVLYGAGRAAHVPLVGLQPAWPWLLGYMAVLGLLYAAYFTGTTGQTLGKMLFGLRVVTRGGSVPGYGEALGRAALGTLGAALAGAGLAPMIFDPARRALHDRVFGTRVVRPAPPTARLS